MFDLNEKEMKNEGKGFVCNTKETVKPTFTFDRLLISISLLHKIVVSYEWVVNEIFQIPFVVLETQSIAIPSISTTPDEYDSYKFTLSDKYKEMAMEELREDESIRTHALAQLRDWIAKHPNIKKCRTGD